MLDVPKNKPKNPTPTARSCRASTDGVGVITFNNPEKRNAMSLDMWEGLGHALVELRDDPDVRVVILTGAGDKAFVSGADISQFEKTRHNAEASEEYSKKSAAQRALLANYPKPIIACIRGFCLGGGMQVAMSADIRIASDNSQFGIPAAKLGIAYGYDGLKHLVSLVGPSWARLIMYTGMRIDSAEAVRIGLVDRVVPDARIVGRDHGDRPHHFRQRAAGDQGRQDHHRAGAEGSRAIATWTRSRQIGTACMDSRGFPRRPPRLHGKAQAAVHGR